MSENGTHEKKLEITILVSVTNPVTGRGYQIAANTDVSVGDDRRATIDDLVDDIMKTEMTPEMREVEGWPK